MNLWTSYGWDFRIHSCTELKAEWSQVHFTHLESEITPSFTARSPNKTFLLTDIGREWAENRMTTSLLFSRGKWSSSFRMWSAKHCRKPKNGGEGSEKSKEGRKEASQKWERYQKPQGNLPNLDLYLFLKKCKQYSLFDLVRLQNGWQWFRGPREFDGKLLTLTNGSLQTNAEGCFPLGRAGHTSRWKGNTDGKEKLF